MKVQILDKTDGIFIKVGSQILSENDILEAYQAMMVAKLRKKRPRKHAGEKDDTNDI